jgi:hypothetical protein
MEPPSTLIIQAILQTSNDSLQFQNGNQMSKERRYNRFAVKSLINDQIGRVGESAKVSGIRAWAVDRGGSRGERFARGTSA